MFLFFIHRSLTGVRCVELTLETFLSLSHILLKVFDFFGLISDLNSLLLGFLLEDGHVALDIFELTFSCLLGRGEYLYPLVIIGFHVENFLILSSVFLGME